MADYKEALIAYVPVIHAGYMDLFERHSLCDMNVLDSDVLADFPHLRKDVRALEPPTARQLIEAMSIFPTVKLLGKTALNSLEHQAITMPDDDVSRQLHQDYFQDKDVVFEPVFLRWDRNNSFVNIEVEPDETVQSDGHGDRVVELIYEEAKKSSDWWRQVGAALVDTDKGVVNAEHNRHLPSEYSPWIDGDPRNNAYRGVATEAATVQHAEASLIAQAAREGRPVEGLDLFVTTFPCPACAKLIAEAGVKTCYYTEGYAMTDGLRVMKDAGVKIIKIDGIRQDKSGLEWKQYPKK